MTFNAAHAPTPIAKDAFGKLLHRIKFEIVKSRKDWDKHEPKMWSRAAELSDSQLESFTIDDLVQVRSGPTSYGTIILGKFRIPGINDAEGAGYVHVRCAFLSPLSRHLFTPIRIHDPPNKVCTCHDPRPSG